MLCWRKQSKNDTEVLCSNVQHYFKRGARGADFTVIFEPKNVENNDCKKRSREEASMLRLRNTAAKLYCSTCDTMIDTKDPLSRDHLKYQCTAVPSTPLKPGYDRASLARRMAALGSKKKLHNHNFSPHKSSPPTQEPRH